MNSGDSSKFHRDEEGLILPKKLTNPCIGSKELQNVHREMKWNAKKGVNVLSTKSELKLAMEKRNRNRIEIERKFEGEENKSQFQIALEERAKRLDDMERKQVGDSCDIDSGHCSPEPENEFLKVHAQLKKVRNLP
eukprot:TRINITY_DN4153_c0_g1_i2.p1 TRINITY_DN4153_c0_g1~~TRINITY_DN4153_c0_g1_i2.p1  ORF type:complete len:136 (-),score=40.57 TRINITY_DN4153_c0_g1_i2:430-837(-)